MNGWLVGWLVGSFVRSFVDSQVVAGNFQPWCSKVVSVLIVVNTCLSFPLPLVPVFKAFGITAVRAFHCARFTFVPLRHASSVRSCVRACVRACGVCGRGAATATARKSWV